MRTQYPSPLDDRAKRLNFPFSKRKVVKLNKMPSYFIKTEARKTVEQIQQLLEK